MALSNYGDLKTAIAKWMMDSGNVVDDAIASDCVALSQALFNTRLRCREMLTTTDLSPTSNVFTLPDDYAQWDRVVEKASPRRSLHQISAEQADARYPHRSSGLGECFTIVGSELTVFPLISNDIELTYYQRIAAFSSETATDWLLTRYPHVYLCAGQMYAADYLKDAAEYAKHAQSLSTYIDMLSGQDDAALYAGGPVYGSGMKP